MVPKSSSLCYFILAKNRQGAQAGCPSRGGGEAPYRQRLSHKTTKFLQCWKRQGGGCSRPPAGHLDTSGFSEDETNVQTGGCSSSSTSWPALSGESNYYSTFSKDCGKEYVIYLLQWCTVYTATSSLYLKVPLDEGEASNTTRHKNWSRLFTGSRNICSGYRIPYLFLFFTG